MHTQSGESSFVQKALFTACTPFMLSLGVACGVSVRVCLDSLMQSFFPPGTVPSAAVEAADSSSEWFRCGWRAGAGSAGGFESGGGERRHGSVLSQVRYV